MLWLIRKADRRCGAYRGYCCKATIYTQQVGGLFLHLLFLLLESALLNRLIRVSLTAPSFKYCSNYGIRLQCTICHGGWVNFQRI